MPNANNILLQDLRNRVIRDMAYRMKTASDMLEAVPLLDHMPDFAFLFNYWTINWFHMSKGFMQVHFSPVTYKYEDDLNAQDAGDSEETATLRFYELQGGFIPKFAAHFENMGWQTTKTVTPSRSEADNTDNTEVDVKIRAVNGNQDDWGNDRILVEFFGIDPDKLEKSNPTCRVEYERVEVPAKVMFRAKVVCDDQEQLNAGVEGQPTLQEAI